MTVPGGHDEILMKLFTARSSAQENIQLPQPQVENVVYIDRFYWRKIKTDWYKFVILKLIT